MARGGEKAGFLLRRGAYFDGCCASSICVCSPSPFLCSEKLEMAEVTDCLFCNITTHHNGKGCCDRTLQRSVVENCEIEGCEDVFGGRIVSGARGNEFSARNTTFCRMTSAHHDSHYTTPFDEFTTGEVSFVNCDFENCRSTSHGGGAICVGGTASLSVQRCTFTNVSTTVGRGGAINSYSTSSVEINGASFTRCSSDGFFGGALAAINSSLSMGLCIFEQCSSSYGGAINVEYQSYLRIIGTNFYNCKATNQCGGAAHLFCPFETVNFLENELIFCSSVTPGGGIDIYDNTRKKNVSFKHCLFICNEVFGNNKYGFDVYFGDGFSSMVTSEWITDSYSISNKTKRICLCNFYSFACENPTFHDEWLPVSSSEMNRIILVDVKQSTTESTGDYYLCGAVSHECKTLKYGVSRWVDWHHELIRVRGGTYEESEMVIAQMNVMIEPNKDENEEEETVTVVTNAVGHAMFEVESGSMQMAGMILKHTISNECQQALLEMSGKGSEVSFLRCEIMSAATSAVGQHSYFGVKAGKMKMAQCTVKNIELENCGVIEWGNGGMVEMDGSNFSNITRREGNGAVVGKNGGATEKVWIQNISVKDCVCQKGNGGGIEVVVENGCDCGIGGAGMEAGFERCRAEEGSGSGSRSETTNEKTSGGGNRNEAEEGRRGCGGGICVRVLGEEAGFKIGAIQFSGNSAAHGEDVCVFAPHLEKVVTRTSFGYYSERGEFSIESAEGMNDGLRGVWVPLVFYLRSREGNVSVGEDGTDVRPCGFSEYRCLSVGYALGQQSDCHQVLVWGSYQLNESLVLDDEKGYVWSGTEDMSKMRMVGSSMGVNGIIEVKTSARLKKLSMTVGGALPSTQRSVIIVSNARASCVIQDSWIGPESSVGEIGFSILVVEAGQCTASGITFEKLEFSDRAMIGCSGSGSKLIMSTVRIENVKCRNTNGVMNVDASAELTLSNTTVLGMENGGNSESVIIGNRARLVMISGVSVSGVGLEAGNGGVVKGTIGSGQRLCVENSSVNGECMKGNGGGMELRLEKGGVVEIGMSENVAFAGCRAVAAAGAGGFGGGMHVVLAGTADDFVVKKAEFTGCSASRKGSGMFVKAPLLSKVINSTTIGFGPDLGDEEGLAGVEGGDESFYVPLVLYLRGEPDVVAVGGGNAKDFDRCGYSGYPCQTMDFALDRWQQDRGLTCVVDRSTSLSCEVGFRKGRFSIEGKEQKAVFVVNENSEKAQEGMIEQSAEETNMSRMEFSMPQQLNGRVALAKCIEGLMRVMECSVSVRLSTNIEFSVFVVSGGELGLVGFRVDDVMFSGGWMVRVMGMGIGSMKGCEVIDVQSAESKELLEVRDGGVMRVENTTMEGVADSFGSAISDKKGKEVSVKNSSICGMWKAEGNGGMIEGEIENGMRIEVSGVRVRNCGSKAGCGGGMRIVLKGSGEFECSKMEGLSEEEMRIAECGAEGSGANEGCGGGLMIECVEGGSGFALKSVVFGVGEEENKASRGGKNVFVKGEGLRGLVNVESFGFEFMKEVGGTDLKELEGCEDGLEGIVIPLVMLFREAPERCYVGEDGEDTYECGFKDYMCETIEYGAEQRFGGKKAMMRLDRSFVIRNRIVVTEQEMEVDGEVNGSVIAVEGSKGDSGDGVILIENAAVFTGLQFSVGELSDVPRKCLFECSGGELALTDCSINAQSGEGLGMVECANGGKVNVMRLRLCDVELGSVGAIEVKGNGSTGVIEWSVFEDVKTRGKEGVIVAEEGGHVEVMNSSVNWSSFGDNSGVHVSEGASGIIVKCNMSELRRENRDGGGVSGVAGDGKKIEVRECEFFDVKCLRDMGKGGSVSVRVRGGGALEFEGNSVGKSMVNEESGVGGGVYVKFDSEEGVYWMRYDRFEENKASVGRDVYFECVGASKMLKQMRWVDTADEDEEEEEKQRLWVYDRSNEPVINVTMFAFLFPAGADILFVDKGGTNFEECGIQATPCKDVSFGFEKLGSTRTTIRIVESAAGKSEMRQKDESLTLQGKNKAEVATVLRMEENGGFVVEGSRKMELSVQRLQVVVCVSWAKEAVFGVGGKGAVSVQNCSICGELGSTLSGVGNGWIGKGSGGEISFVSVNFEQMELGAGCGVAEMKDGKLIVEKSNMSGLCGSVGGLICGRGESDVSIRETNVKGCRVFGGSVARMSGVSQIKVWQGSLIEECRSDENMDGGGMWCELVGESEVMIEDCRFCKCMLTKDNGRGGGVFLDLQESASNNFAFKRVTFEGNTGAKGEDVFVVSKSLNESIIADRFVDVSGAEEGSVRAKIAGIDSEFFVEEAIDLYEFLVERRLGEIRVGEKGYDFAGCGTDKYQCKTLWRGYRNIDGLAAKKRLLMDGEVYAEESYDLSSFEVSSMQDQEESCVRIQLKNGEGVNECVFGSSTVLEMKWIVFKYEESLEAGAGCLVYSSGSKLTLNRSRFENMTRGNVKVTLVKCSSGVVMMEECEVLCQEFESVPFALWSGAEIEGCVFDGLRTRKSMKGGAIYAVLGKDGVLKMENNTIARSECSRSAGRGGGVYVDSLESEAEKPFEFCRVLKLEGNEAARGKNMFIAGKDLNKSVNRASFGFEYELALEDRNLFAGREAESKETDLMRYLVKYTSWEIHVSSGGWDVERCGFEEDPCKTFWKGMEHVEALVPEKKIVVKGETIIADGFDVTNFRICSEGQETGEQMHSMLIFEEKNEQCGNTSLFNRGTL
eukprot:MONOS_11361.1-p1 / transcript=MONOS_11361.1 / gene=MONOS_11361 / organism=Monocercomonoides_exilis_PA203 / gene_product=unspecified product / transcript_product=unspecified product / location=Mono_scaffold00566:3-8201(-) / protein_length=2710 / sequence_SO=supercontig / SO=protein_coding / is_pseudo=false